MNYLKLKRSMFLGAVSIFALTQTVHGANENSVFDNLGSVSANSSSGSSYAGANEVAPTIYPTAKEIADAIKYSLSVGYVKQDANVPAMKNLHNRVGMYESVASGYLLHKYSDRVGRDVAKIPGLVDSELRRLRAQHKRNLELLKTMGTIVDQVIYENFKNRRNNSKLQGLIGAKQDGAIGPKSKAKSVQVVQDTIRDDLALKDRIYILEWDSVVANRIKDSVYASNILSTGYPYVPKQGDGVAPVRLPQLVTVASRLEQIQGIMEEEATEVRVWNKEPSVEIQQPASQDNQPAKKKSQVVAATPTPQPDEEDDLANLDFAELEEPEIEVKPFYVRAMADDSYAAGFENDLNAKSPKKAPGKVFFWGPMDLEVYANRRVYGSNTNVTTDHLENGILPPAHRRELHKAHDITETLVHSLQVNTTNFAPQAGSLGMGRFVGDSENTFYHFTGHDITRLKGEQKLVVSPGKHDIKLDFEWRHANYGRGDCVSTVGIGNKQLYKGKEVSFTFEHTFKVKKKTPYLLKYEVSCPSGQDSQLVKPSNSYDGFEQFSITGKAGYSDILQTKKPIVNRVDIFNQGDDYEPPVLSVYELSKDASVKREGNVRFDLLDINALTSESQARGLRDGRHDKQLVVTGEFIPQVAGLYEFGIGTKTNVCTTSIPYLERVQNDYSTWWNARLDEYNFGDAKRLVNNNKNKKPYELFTDANYSHHGDGIVDRRDRTPNDLENLASPDSSIVSAICRGPDGNGWLAGPSVNIALNGKFVGNNGRINDMFLHGKKGVAYGPLDSFTRGNTGFQTVPVVVTEDMVGKPQRLEFHVSSNITYDDTAFENFTNSKKYGAAVYDVDIEKSKGFKVPQVFWASDINPGHQRVYLSMRAPNEVYYRPFTANDFVKVEPQEALTETTVKAFVEEPLADDEMADWEASLMGDEDMSMSDIEEDLGSLEDGMDTLGDDMGSLEDDMSMSDLEDDMGSLEDDMGTLGDDDMGTLDDGDSLETNDDF